MELSDARKYLRIDQSLLIVECAEQPIRQEEVHRAYIHACSRRDQVKIELDEALAGASEELRGQKDDNGRPLTGERVAYLIQADPSVINKKQVLARAVQEAAMWQALVDAMQSRRRMLSDLTALILQGAPAAPPPAATSNAYQIQRRRLAIHREERA